MFNDLTKRFSSIVKKLRGEAYLTEENIRNVIRDVRVALLEADVALPVVTALVERLKKIGIGKKVIDSLNPSQMLIGLVHKELVSVMSINPENKYGHEISLAMKPPAVILMVGLQGAGKTTTIAKLSYWFSKGMHTSNGRKTGKKRILAASTDIYRPAAIDQLKYLIKESGCDFFDNYINQDPCQIALNALKHASLYHYDVLLLDTAGRTTIDHKMMDELSNLHNLVKPIETFLVVDAMQGQDSINTAKGFSEKLDVTGVVLTKLDSDSRGGSAISVLHTVGSPLKFVGISEKLDGLELFYPDRMANRILGMGDIISLVEKAEENLDSSKSMIEKIKSNGYFDLDDFSNQLNQIKKLGSISSLFSKLPAHFKRGSGQQIEQDQAEKWIRCSNAILCSMTKEEKKTPSLIKFSRKKRIALGSGTSVQHVNQLLNQFEQMSGMMRKIKKGGLKKMLRLLN